MYKYSKEQLNTRNINYNKIKYKRDFLDLQKKSYIHICVQP